MSRLTRNVGPNSQARTGAGENKLFLVQLTTSRIGNHARLIHTLSNYCPYAYVLYTEHKLCRHIAIVVHAVDYIAWTARKESPSKYEGRFVGSFAATLRCGNGPTILPCHNQFSTIRPLVTKGQNFQDNIFCGGKFWGRVLQLEKWSMNLQ